jgi:prolyl-tRNA synthetase
VTKSGSSDLAEPIAIRPTSETIMYPAYANWIKSHRDLPLKLNQWTNIVRWEFKHPTPFIRTREFLWQEGHTAHATFQEAEVEMFDNLEFYYRVYKEVLAVPVCKGIKTESEKFPGGYKTSTVETWIPENGRAIQAATSHNLGQNFAKMFSIEFEDEKKEKKLVWQTSWGLTTRSIGIMTMYHGDDKGLVLPPRVANVQVIIIPIPFKGKEQDVVKAATALHDALKKTDIRVQIDARDNYNPGWKFNHWELKGVPIRLELGPKDIENQEARVVLRYNGEKLQIKWAQLEKELPVLLEKIQESMYERAVQRFNDKAKQAGNWQDFMTHLNSRNVVLTPWCEIKECEEKVK